MKLDAALLAAATGCPRERAEAYAAPLAEACMRYAIDTPARLAMFLAQIGHESGSLRYVAELWGPTPAQARYEGRLDLGNGQPGDGQRFKGRGLIQITGRANYTSVRDRLRAAGIDDVPDFVERPEALEAPRWAALSAGDYWSMRGINAAADAGDLERATRAVNGGLNGFDDRRVRWEKAKAVLAMGPHTHQAAPAATIATKEGQPMLPFIAAALPSIVQAVPKLIEMFGSGSEVAQRNAKAAETVVGIAQDALGAVNAQQVVETLAADPEAPAKVREAIEAQWFSIVEAGGGGIAGAREADAAFAASRRRSFSSPAFIISLVLLVFPLMLAIDLFYVHPESYNGELRTQIVTAILLCISIVGAFWLGSSYGSMRKTEAAQMGA